MVGHRRILVLAIAALVVLVAAPCHAGFALRVSATGSSVTEVRDGGVGDYSSEAGIIMSSSTFVVGGTTIIMNFTTGSSKPNAPNGFYTRGMTLTNLSLEQRGDPLAKAVTITLVLTDTNFAPLSSIAPTSLMQSSFAFTNLSAASVTGDFQAFLGEGVLNTEFVTGTSVFTDLQTASSTGGSVTGREIVAPSSLFAMTQVAHITFAKGSQNGAVQFIGQTLVYVPEPTTFAIWGGLCGLGVACSWIRRRYSKDLTPQV